MTFILPDKIQGARALLNKAAPYFKALTQTLIPVDTPGLGTMGTDMHARWYIDSKCVADWELGIISATTWHETLHLWLKHHTRLQGKDARLANIAMDFAVNSMLEGMIKAANNYLEDKEKEARATSLALYSSKNIESPRLSIPDNWLHPRNYNLPEGLLAEEYYKLIEDNNTLKQNINNNIGGGGSGEDSKPDPGRGNCGSCASGHQEHEQPPPDNNENSSIIDGISEVEMDILSKQVAREALEFNSTMTRGTLPLGLIRLANKLLEKPKVPWTRELRSSLRSAITWASGAVDINWNRYSKRSTPQILLPAWAKPIVTIAGIIDTSGSMSKSLLHRAISEAQGVIRACSNTRIKFLSVDAAVHSCKVVQDITKFDLIGGGGTDMVLGITTALELKPKPKIIIVFTDGETPWPIAPINNVRIIAALVRKPSIDPPAWIRAVEAF